MIKRFLMIVLLGLTLFRVQADPLSSSISGMLGNMTQPQSIQSNMRGGFVGGGAYIRMPNSSINIISIDAPRLSAGCGGIDATLGGFSYISATKLMDFFRKVIQQAVPVAFQLALQQLSPQVAIVLKDFQTWAQQASSLSSNSCQLATGIAQSAVNLVASETNQASNVGKQYTTAAGLFSDAMEAADDFISKPSEYFSKLKDRAAKYPNGNTNFSQEIQCQVGNITWCGLNYIQNKGLVMNLDTDENMAKQMIMSLLGTRVVVAADAEEDQPIVLEWQKGTLDIQQFIHSTNNGKITIIDCNGDYDECKRPTSKEINFTGIEGYVKTMLYGNADPSQNGILPTSIVGLLSGQNANAGCDPRSAVAKNCSLTNAGFSPAQVSFLSNISNIPVLAFLLKTQHDPAMMQGIAEDLVPLIVDHLGLKYIDNVYAISRSVYNGNGNQPPTGLVDRYKEMQEATIKLRDDVRKKSEKLHTIVKNIDLAYKTSPELRGFQGRMVK